MPASISDKITNVSTGVRPVSTTVSTIRNSGATTLATADLTGWATDTAVHFVTYKIDGQGKVIAGSQSDWKGIVTGANINNLTLTGGTDAGNAAGDIVEILPTARWGKDLNDALRTAHNADGSLIQAAVQSALGIASIPPADWTSLPIVPLLTTSNGQKENSLTFTGADYTDRLQKGSKLRIPRTSTVPTQSATFVAASSQYANKTSPAGMTFTNNFTIEGWINPASYAVGIVGGRLDATGNNGFYMRMEATGQITLQGANAGVGHFATTYQSVPLNKRTHVAATWATGVILIYFDGVLVPNTTTGAPTTIVQGTDFAIGRGGALAIQYFNGEVSDFRIHSVVKTAAQIRDNMGKQLIGNEANLVGYWKLNGDFLDSTANANHLTAQAGAVATTVSHAFSPIEYAVVTSTPVFAAGNTTCTVFTGNGVLPNETLGATSYSGQRAPFGFPAASNKWRLQSLLKTSSSSTSNALYGSFISGGWALLVASGEWNVGWHAGAIATNSTTEVDFNISSTSLVGLSQVAANNISPYVSIALSPAAGYAGGTVHHSQPQTIAALSTYVMYSFGATIGANINGTLSLCEIFAECTLL